jgi:antitoxin component YwqK of YwqJK toxin-antitoxin module
MTVRRIDVADTEDDQGGVFFGGEPFTGEVVEEAPDGSLASLYTYWSGMEHGPYFEWFGPERPYKQGQFRHGLPIGVNRVWFANGRLAQEVEFDEVGRQVYRREWNESGELTSEYVRDPSRG